MIECSLENAVAGGGKPLVGILTMVGGENYGNQLQNYAVQSLIEKHGFTAITLMDTTINGFMDSARNDVPAYRKLAPSYVRSWLRVKGGSDVGAKNDRDFPIFGAFGAASKDQAVLAANRERIERFREFRKREMKDGSVEINSRSWDRDYINKFYAFICGSDQVWNPYYPTTSPVSFLQFAPKHKRIALAPSFGVSEIPEVRKADFAAWLDEIPALSVREEAGAEIIKDLCGRDAKVLLDPTFGLTAGEWRGFSRRPRVVPEADYVFCYFLGNMNARYQRWIEARAKSAGSEIVYACDVKDLKHYADDPQEFVWLIDHAKAVFTDSFHGTALSINLETPFVVFPRDEGGASMGSRLETVMAKTGLQNRALGVVEEKDVFECDFSNARECVSMGREEICSFLATALANVAEESKRPHPLLASKYHCTGCGACFDACRVGALSMREDGEGFSYPVINDELCVRCGECENACPSDRARVLHDGTQAFCMFSKDEEVCNNSSSGGAFTLIAREAFKKGGTVYGAGFDEDFKIVHLSVSDEKELGKLRTSKYVQSDVMGRYREIESRLKEGEVVLFSGTPCQIAALKRFLGKPYDGLLAIDLVCHGVPSPGVWRRYLKECHGNHEIASINFRDKTRGWNGFGMKIAYQDGSEYYNLATDDPFERAFLANLTLRPVCHQCQYKTISRCSDITLADYWGVELVHPELKEQQGVSLVLVHSKKGEQVIQSLARNSSVAMFGTDLGKATAMNSGSVNSPNPHRNRRCFFQKFASDAPFDSLVAELLKPTKVKVVRDVVITNGSRVKQAIRRVRGK